MSDLYDAGTAARFAGWYRPDGGRWRFAVSDDDRWRCYTLLLTEVLRLQPPHVECTVTEGGRRPWEKARPLARPDGSVRPPPPRR